MGVLKKINRKEKEYHRAKMLAIQNLTQHIYKNVLKGKIIMLASDIKKKLVEEGKEIELDFDCVDYTLIHLGEQLIKNEEFFNLLSQCVYTDGIEDSVHIHNEKFNEFSNYVLNNIGIDYIYPVISNYNPKVHKFERTLEGMKIMTSNILGEAQEISQEGDL